MMSTLGAQDAVDPEIHEVNGSNLGAFLSLPHDGPPIEVQIFGNSLKKEGFLKLATAPALLSRIDKLTLHNVEIGFKELIALVSRALGGGLTELNFFDVKTKTLRISAKERWFSKKLHTLRMVNCDFSTVVFRAIHVSSFPGLRHLSIVNCGLEKKHIPMLKRIKFANQVEYLDLSGNAIGDDIFTLFENKDEGALRILKLNNCGIAAEETHSLLPNLFGPKDGEILFDFESPLFSSLKHLEVGNALRDTSKILELYRLPFIQNLEVFEGPLYKVKSEVQKKEQLKELQFIKKLVTLPLASRRTNIDLRSIAIFNIFKDSPMATRVENVLFTGALWTDDALRMALGQLSLEKIKEISLNSVNMSQYELRALIFDYPEINFEISLPYRELSRNRILGTVMEYWPRIELEK